MTEINKKDKGKNVVVINEEDGGGSLNNKLVHIPIYSAALGGFRRRRGRSTGSLNKLPKKIQPSSNLNEFPLQVDASKKRKIFNTETNSANHFYKPDLSGISRNGKRSHGMPQIEPIAKQLPSCYNFSKTLPSQIYLSTKESSILN
ncbi:hypothetical protein FRX31_029858 [Thalictrum thalictroides]|uniref:Uncharacterized protein n=1 Tax=Thalictrum thalictroides TaxID=46969 RepID=A0A7J6V628_THATH|nr:hypothetical protein FRX31_029858 [Thalictrum thalictroides]